MEKVRAYVPVMQFFNDDGSPMVGGHLNTYKAGTSIPVTTYADASGTMNPASIPLDSRGECVVYVEAGMRYKLVLVNKDGVVKWTADNYSVSGGSGGGGSGIEISYDDENKALVFSNEFEADDQQETNEVNKIVDGAGLEFDLRDPTKVSYEPQSKTDAEKKQARLNIGAAALLSLASTFSTSTAYNEGDVVTYDGALYIFDTAHAAGAWTGADAHETNIMEVLAMAAGATEKPTTIISAPIYVGGNSAQLDIYTYANNNHSSIVTFTGQCLLDFRPNAGVTTSPIGGNALDVVSFSRNNKLKIKRARITTQGSQGIGAANGQKAAQLLLLGYKIDGVAVASVDYFYLAIDNYNEWQDINATYDVAKNGPFSSPSFDLKIVDGVNDTSSKLTIDDYNLQGAYEGQALQACLELEVETDSIV